MHEYFIFEIMDMRIIYVNQDIKNKDYSNCLKSSLQSGHVVNYIKLDMRDIFKVNEQISQC